ncbi:MAG: SDR family oxidoreductase [Candidatus Promineifilaceae bacterium]
MKTTHNTVLITGGSSGIGLALAKKFLAEGNEVIITGTNAEKLSNVRQALPGIKVEAANMMDTNALEHLVEKYPDVNILINNAGVQYNYSFPDQDASIDLVNNELQTNLVGPVQLITLMLPHLLSKREAAVINVTSSLGVIPKQSAPVYCGSKAGLHIFTRTLRWQLESTNVKVFELIPPLVETKMTEGRGKRKITPDTLVEEFWPHFSRDNYEVRIGLTKLLFTIQRFAPSVAERMVRQS